MLNKPGNVTLDTLKVLIDTHTDNVLDIGDEYRDIEFKSSAQYLKAREEVLKKFEDSNQKLYKEILELLNISESL